MNYPDIRQLPNLLSRPEIYLESRTDSYDFTPPLGYHVQINAEDILFHEGYFAFRASDSVRQEFDSLAQTWRRETGHYSLLQQKILHPAYQQIIGMGERALPSLIKALDYKPSHWFWALRAITRNNPAERSETVGEAVNAWRNWWSNRSRNVCQSGFLPTENVYFLG